MPDNPPHGTRGPSWGRPMAETELAPPTREEPRPAPRSDAATREVVGRLARRHPSGGTVIERAAILAEGADSTAVVAWVIAHGGQPEAAVVSTKRGLHSPRLLDDPAAAGRPPLRYVLPAGALA